MERIQFCLIRLSQVQIINILYAAINLPRSVLEVPPGFAFDLEVVRIFLSCLNNGVCLYCIIY
jgi:hypothetical protein